MHYLDVLSSKYVKNISFDKLKELTGGQVNGQYQYNSTYGSQYPDDLSNMRFPGDDWVDEFDKTGTYSKENEYKYNLGQACSATRSRSPLLSLVHQIESDILFIMYIIFLR